MMPAELQVKQLPDTDLIEGIEEVCKKMILNMLTLPVWEVSKNVVI